MIRRRLVLPPILTLLLLCGSLLQPAHATSLAHYFPETGQTVSGELLQFWQSTPQPLAVLGYPISAPFIQESTTSPGTFLRVQYFERAVLEEHTAADRSLLIQGRLLGNEIAAGRRDEAPFVPVPRPTDAGSAWDDVTRHTLANQPAPFASYYAGHGGLRVFGRPISEQFQELNRDTGVRYWVQYFERQRMEWHPEEPPAARVQLGRLGDEYRLAHPETANHPAFRRRAAPDDAGHMRYGVNAALFYTDRERVLDLAADAGLSWVRQQIHWKDHQSADGSIAWGQLDAIVAAAETRQIKLLFSVLQAPDWATGIPGVTGLPDRAHYGAYAAFMGALAERYRGRVQAYQIWNEINLPADNGMQPIPTPAEYVELLARSSAAIKAADPDALVISTALAPTDRSEPGIALGDLVYFRALFAEPRFWASVDAVGVHVFGYANPPDTLWPAQPGPGIGWNTSREFYFRRVEDVRAAMVESGHGSRTIWITEFGWATANTTPGHEFGAQVSAEQQATYLRAALEMGRFDYTPWVGAMFVWNLNFAVTWQAAGEPQHQMAAYGILNGDWSPRPAYIAIRQMPKP